MNIFRLKRKTKKISLKRYLLLIFSLIMTTFAWFAYSKILETDIALDLLPWDIKFFIGEVEKFNPIDIVMQDLYPGMEDRTVDVVIQNNGRVEAGVYFQVNEVTLLGDTYNLVSDANAELGEDDLYLPEPTIDNRVLSQYVINDPERFPFTVYIASVTQVSAVSEGILTIKISWPGDNDELDTKWGYDVAQFYNSGSPVGQPLKISLQIDVTQNEYIYASPITLFDREGENEEGLHIGDFVEYDAGTWTQEEIDAIQTGEVGYLKTANGSTSLPNTGFQFGGFTAGSSRNGNATPTDSAYDYVKDKSTGNAITGWRVLDIAEDGSVTLISAGSPEDYVHRKLGASTGYASEYILTGNVNGGGFEFEYDEEGVTRYAQVDSENISNYLTKRDWSDYINTSQKAVSASVLTFTQLFNWYEEYITTNPDLNEYETFQRIYREPHIKYQNMIDNYSYYYLGEAYSEVSGSIRYIRPDRRCTGYHTYATYGLRVVITLSSDVEFATHRTGTKTVTGGNMDTYGGEQTYNVWKIRPEEETIPEEDIFVSVYEIFDSDGTNADGLHIGDFVNYDAGTWTQEEIDAIQVGEIGNEVTANGSTDLPTEAFQFGGFTAGSSRNGNATPYQSSYNYVKDASTQQAITGWRVFDIADDGTVTLISAGNPEDYRHNRGVNYGYISEYILTGQVNSNWSTSEANNYQKRNWSNYINTSQKAVSATVLTKSRLDNWYSKYIVANADTLTAATFQKIYEDTYEKYQNMVENYSYYWLSETTGMSGMIQVIPGNRTVNSFQQLTGCAQGVRVLVTLSPDAQFTKQKVGTKTTTGGNMDTYGGNQIYNVWGIKTESGTSGGGTSGGNTSGGSGSGSGDSGSTNDPNYVSVNQIFDSTGSNTDSLHIGDFVNYTAGTWTQDEINAIQVGEIGNLVTANGSADFPDTAFQFGGFKSGDSRDGNATTIYDTSYYNYVKDASTGEAITGWRVFDIEEDGKVTLISAGNPEDYCQDAEWHFGYISEYILTGQVNSNWSTSEANNYQKRNWSNYINTSQKAESATVLTKSRLDSWYSKYIVANADTYTDRTTFQMIYDEPEYHKYQNMIESGSLFWLAESTGNSYGYMYVVYNNFRFVGMKDNFAVGVRILVTLSSDVKFTSTKTGTITLTSGNMDRYGGDQTYNCWGIK